VSIDECLREGKGEKEG